MKLIDVGAKFLVLAFIVVLAACSGQATKDESENTAEPVAEDSEAETTIEAPFVAIAKPVSPESKPVPSSARQEFARAHQSMVNQNWAEAEGLLLLMTETYPELSGVYANLGIVYQKQEKWTEAENAYKYAIQVNAHNFDAYTNLGVLYREQGKFQDAEVTYKKALALWPHHQSSLVNLGVLYDLYLGQYELALENYELAQKLNAEEDRQLKGWIIDLQRRLKQ